MSDDTPDTNGFLYRDASPCGACGGNHETLRFRPFARARRIMVFAGPHSVPATHWGLCPATDEPLLTSDVELPDGDPSTDEPPVVADDPDHAPGG